jgi:hypothetical protein
MDNAKTLWVTCHTAFYQAKYKNMNGVKIHTDEEAKKNTVDEIYGGGLHQSR